MEAQRRGKGYGGIFRGIQALKGQGRQGAAAAAPAAAAGAAAGRCMSEKGAQRQGPAATQAAGAQPKDLEGPISRRGLASEGQGQGHRTLIPQVAVFTEKQGGQWAARTRYAPGEALAPLCRNEVCAQVDMKARRGG